MSLKPILMQNQGNSPIITNISIIGILKRLRMKKKESDL